MNHSVMQNANQDLAHLRPQASDEIDLGQLIRNIIEQWRLITTITALGALLSVIFAIAQPSIYRVETVITAPSIAQLGDLNEQTLFEVSPSLVLERVVSELISVKNQSIVFEESTLKTEIAKDSEFLPEQIFLNIKNNLNVSRIDHDFFAAAQGDATDLKEVKISFTSAYPGEAKQYLDNLVAYSLNQAKNSFEEDAQIKKTELVQSIEERLSGLTDAAKTSREAEIKRLEDSLAEQIADVELELSLLEAKARQDRLNRIEQLKEALAAAEALEIEGPVTWDDLRATRPNAQIFNDLDSSEKEEPLYFQGTRFLNAEIKLLESRTNDLLFVESASELQLKLSKLKADTRLNALKNRTDDTVYIANFDELQLELYDVLSQPTQYPAVEVAEVVQPAVTPITPIKPNRKLIAVAGTVLAGFLALFIALIRIAIRPPEKV